MCGIIGIFGNENSSSLVIKGLRQMKNRGRDGFGLNTQKTKKLNELKPEVTSNSIGHCLHSVVGNVRQPINSKFVANCEIYNWKKLNKYGCKNDAELLFTLLKQDGIKKTLKRIDGDYAFAFIKGDNVTIARDLIGIKPLFYSHNDGFSFASEKKVLENLGYLNIYELNPRDIITYNLKSKNLKIIRRKFYTAKDNTDSIEKITRKLKKLIIEAIRKRLPDGKFGILFSGGVDSTLLAFVCKKLGLDFTCYTVAIDEPTMEIAQDLKSARKVAKTLGLKLKEKKIGLDKVPGYLNKIVPLIEDTNVTKTGVGLVSYLACEQAKKDNIKVIFSGLGSEEIFAGYARHKNACNINKECVSGLLKMYERDTYRDDVITMANNLELRVPFLDKALIKYALSIPGKYKIEKGIEKAILRRVAIKLGMPKEFAYRKKTAAQYGSKTDRAITALAKRKGYKLKSLYIKTFYKKHNLKLGVLFSGGKDSVYAMYVMHRQNYEISCLISLKSKNKDSYMFHTPGIDMVKLQAKALGLPLIMQSTEGVKEKEIKDLKNALVTAKKKYCIDGIVTGALYSTYQRDRIEKVCDKLGLKVFSPLWHINQETEMKEILKNEFHIIMTGIAAEGLDSTWLNKKITFNDVGKLKELNKKNGLNIAGEGGEFETLALDMPLFRKKIQISAKKNMENEITGRLIISDAKLIDK